MANVVKKHSISTEPAQKVVGAIGLSGAPTVQNDVDCARAALALLPDGTG
jgi:uncharacterized protein GlcG (DUF336 family)